MDNTGQWIKLLWAKTSPYKSLITHLRESALTAKVLLTKTGYRQILEQMQKCIHLGNQETLHLIMYLVAMHDIGKCHPIFQIQADISEIQDIFHQNPKLKYPLQGIKNYRHELGSASIARRIWQQENIFDQRMQRSFSNILKLHHQGKHGRDYFIQKGTSPWAGASFWIEAQNEIEQKFREEFSLPDISSEQIGHTDAVCMMIMGIMILSDWISSSEILSNTFEYEPEEVEKKIMEFVKPIGIDEGISGLPHRKLTDLWAFMTDSSLRPLQRDLQKYVLSHAEAPLAMILEAPMGEGKTEAGIYAAMYMAEYWHKQGFYIGLPTAATSNQMVGRVNEMLKEHHINPAHLIHGTAWMYEDHPIHIEDSDDQSQAERWLMTPKRKMLFPLSVGTVDQAMMSVLKVKYGILRLLGLENKVLIIDEIHAYDAYMSDIILRLLQWCKELEIPVVMLSATLPSEKKNKILQAYGILQEVTDRAYPQITAVYSGKSETVDVQGSYQHNHYDMHISVAFKDIQKIGEFALDKISEGGCICVLVNTVKKAQEVYRYLLKSGTDAKLMLFHARFSAARRQQIEQECVQLFGKDISHRPKKAILVATQVVEQSLDVDFDAMITEIAPIDLILQRIGRVHRHESVPRPEKLSKPEVTVLIPEDDDYESTELIYYKVLLDRSRTVIQEHLQIHVPEDIPVLIEEVYRDAPNPEEVEAFMERMFSNQLQEGQAEQGELRKPSDKSFSMGNEDGAVLPDDTDLTVIAKTRFAEESIRIAILPSKLFDLVQNLRGENIPLKRAELIMKYSVSVSKKSVQYFLKEFEDAGQLIYGKRRLVGVCMICGDCEEQKPEDTVSAEINGKSLIMDHDLGFWKKGV